MRLGSSPDPGPARFSAYEARRGRIGVVDASGTLVWANRAWRAFRRNQGRDTLAAVAVGTNLITFSRRAGGNLHELVAAGIQAVLDRESDRFELELAVPELKECRVEISVTPRPDGAAGAVLMQAERARSDPPGAPPRSTIVGRAIETLTPRELEVLQLMSRGLDNAAIAERLGVGYTTVRAHVSSIMAKLDARSRLAAVVRALQRGIVQPPTGATGRQERDEERVRD